MTLTLEVGPYAAEILAALVRQGVQFRAVHTGGTITVTFTGGF